MVEHFPEEEVVVSSILTRGTKDKEWRAHGSERLLFSFEKSFDKKVKSRIPSNVFHRFAIAPLRGEGVQCSDQQILFWRTFP